MKAIQFTDPKGHHFEIEELTNPVSGVTNTTVYVDDVGEFKFYATKAKDAIRLVEIMLASL
jgi:CxxC motif-containing protein